MANLVPTIVLTFINATTPAPQLEAQSLKAIESSLGQTPATAVVSPTTINVGNFKGVIPAAQFRTAADGVSAATGCKVVKLEDSKVGRNVDQATGKVVYGSTPHSATFDCKAK